jgi:hypothetical protein
MNNTRLSLVRGQLVRALICLLLIGTAAGCRDESLTLPLPEGKATAESSPEEYLIGLLDEIGAIAAWTGPAGMQKKASALEKADAESVYVYGEITTAGYGAVVTERHAYPKGMLLITVRKSYGMPLGHVASEVARYTSVEAMRRGEPEQTSLTEVYGLGDTIVTRVLSNGLQETFTFRLPVITATIGATAELTRSSIRFALSGDVVVETRNGLGQLIQTQRTRGEADGALVTRTEYPDSSWRETRSVGEGDGTVYRETRTGP